MLEPTVMCVLINIHLYPVEAAQYEILNSLLSSEDPELKYIQSLSIGLGRKTSQFELSNSLQIYTFT